MIITPRREEELILVERQRLKKRKRKEKENNDGKKPQWRQAHDRDPSAMSSIYVLRCRSKGPCADVPPGWLAEKLLALAFMLETAFLFICKLAVV